MAITLIQEPEELAYSKNQLIYKISSNNLSGQTLPSLVCKIDYWEGDWVELITINQPGETSGPTTTATFDIQSYIDDFLEDINDSKRNFAYFDLPNQWIYERVNLLVKYRVTFKERYGFPQLDVNPSVQTERYALLGGVSNDLRAILNDKAINLSFIERNFLTWQPKTLSVFAKQEHSLYFAVPPSVNYDVTIQVTYADTSQQSQVVASFPSLSDWWLYEIRTNFDKVELLFPTPENIVSYNFTITANGQAVSQSQTFVIDRTQYPNFHSYHFRNSLGGYDSLNTYGVLEENSNYERNFLTRILPANFTNLDRQKSGFRVSEEQVFNVATGWITKERATHLRDLLTSVDVWETDVEKSFRIIMLNQSVRIDRENTFLQQFLLEYARSFSESRPFLYDNGIQDNAFNFILDNDNNVLLEN